MNFINQFKQNKPFNKLGRKDKLIYISINSLVFCFFARSRTIKSRIRRLLIFCLYLMRLFSYIIGPIYRIIKIKIRTIYVREKLKILYKWIDIKPIIIKPKRVSIELNNKIQGVYLIGTEKGLYILKDSQLFFLLKGRIYGITKKENEIFVYQVINYQRKIKFNMDLKSRIIKLNMGKEYNIQKKGECLVDNLPIGCHQIDLIDNDLYICDTYHNRILRYNINNDKSHDSFFPLGKLRNGRNSENYAHMNSIFGTDDKIYILCHNSSTKTGKYSNVIVMDRNLEKIIETIDTTYSNAHNIVLYNDKILICDSQECTLNDLREKLFQTEYLTRGLSVSEDNILLGGSDITEREFRIDSKGYLYFLNHDFDLIESITIPSCVKEIRRIDKRDFSISNC